MSIEIEVIKREQVPVKFLRVSAGVRYWEDAEVNGVEDTDGALVPMRQGDEWNLMIDLDTGKIVDWPNGVSVSVHYKVCDQGLYWLADKDGKDVVKWLSDYVPDDLLCIGDRGFGDYIIMEIDGDGQIAGWKRPAFDPEQWEAV